MRKFYSRTYEKLSDESVPLERSYNTCFRKVLPEATFKPNTLVGFSSVRYFL